MMTTKDEYPSVDALADCSLEGLLEVAAWPLPEESTVTCGRGLIRVFLTALGLDDETVEDGVLIGTELVTNAVRHAKPPYELRIYRYERTVVCEVADGLEIEPSIPRREITYLTLAELDEIDDFDQLESGRGLDVVYRLSNGRCGSRSTEVHVAGSLTSGKGMWFALDLPPRREGES
jgi:anti-sigma regulatory factor (Ser/Thr protein kinase)